MQNCKIKIQNNGKYQKYSNEKNQNLEVKSNFWLKKSQNFEIDSQNQWVKKNQIFIFLSNQTGFDLNVLTQHGQK